MSADGLRSINGGLTSTRGMRMTPRHGIAAAFEVSGGVFRSLDLLGICANGGGRSVVCSCVGRKMRQSGRGFKIS